MYEPDPEGQMNSVENVVITSFFDFYDNVRTDVMIFLIRNRYLSVIQLQISKQIDMSKICLGIDYSINDSFF